MQKLWLLGLGWDDELPDSEKNEWLAFQRDVNAMSEINVPRWLGLSKTNVRVEIHGFSDASQVAYSAVVYVRIIDAENKVNVKLVAARTRVAPVKQISIPRLELCGAVLTAKLMYRVKKCLNVLDNNVYGWADSTIVLAWLQRHPSTWKTYVANRVTEILNVTRARQWHHIRSQDNPADCAFRDLLITQLAEHSLWWSGPAWLANNQLIVHNNDIPVEPKDQDLEMKVLVHVNLCDEYTKVILNRYSNLHKLKRVIAYCLRFVRICRSRLAKRRSDNVSGPEPSSYLTVEELKAGMNTCIRMSQTLYYSSEILELSSKRYVTKQSRLYTLNPFLDNENVIRVGGRLKNAPIPENIKYPIVLSDKCHLAYLLVANTHSRTLHGGPQLMLSTLRNSYWILNGKSLVKRYVRSCVTCVRQAPRFLSQLMGNLPSARVTMSRPFSISGIDFAGPVLLKTSCLRKSPITKAYIAVFICTATKAIHLELVSDLTTAAFIAAFKRFTARRGHCSKLYSDCGTNFIGASRELTQMLTKTKLSLPVEISELLANDGTEWSFTWILLDHLTLEAYGRLVCVLPNTTSNEC